MKKRTYIAAEIHNINLNETNLMYVKMKKFAFQKVDDIFIFDL